MKTFLGVVVFTVAAIASACSEPTASPSSAEFPIRAAKPAPPVAFPITVLSLGSLPYSGSLPGAPIALALNNGSSRSATRAAGYTHYGTTAEYPFTWTLSSGISPLDVVEDGYSWPSGVSDAGLIVGEFSNGTGNRAFVVTVNGAMSYLPIPAGTLHSGASAVSADGACVSGYVINAQGGFAALWRNGVIEIVGPGSATGVTNDCLVVSGSSEGRAAVWRSSGSSWTVETLPSAGRGMLLRSGGRLYSQGTDISPNGEYVSGRRVDSTTSYAVVWRRVDGEWIPRDMPGATVYAFGVDNSGRAVGGNASGEPMLWTRSTSGSYSAQRLPSLGRSTQGWAGAINELGQVVGRSRTHQGWQPVIWTIN
jgi:hypothetical protein